MLSVPWVLSKELMPWLTVGTESHSASKTLSTAQVSFTIIYMHAAASLDCNFMHDDMLVCRF